MPTSKLSIFLLAIASLVLLGCKELSEKLPGSKSEERDTTVAPSSTDVPPKRPESIDPEQWAVFQKGLEDIDFDAMRTMIPLDANIRGEAQLAILRRAGLWKPLLKKLPMKMKKVYQAAVDEVGTDIFSRLDAITFSIRYDDEQMVNIDAINEVIIVASTHGGALTDLLRYLQQKEHTQEETENDPETKADDPNIVFIIKEQINSEQYETLKETECEGDCLQRIPVRKDAFIEIYEDGAGWVGSSGVVMQLTRGDEGQKINKIFNLIKQLGRTTGEFHQSEDNLLLHISMQRISLPEFDGRWVSFELDVYLSQSLDIQASIDLIGLGANQQQAKNMVETVRQQINTPETLQNVTEILTRNDLGWLVPVASQALSNMDLRMIGGRVRIQTNISLSTISQVVGGFELDTNHLPRNLGSGLDAEEITRHPLAGLSKQSPQTVAAGIEVQNIDAVLHLSPSQSPRHQTIARWLEQEGTVARVVQGINLIFKWPAPVPVLFRDCGQVNAFYLPIRTAQGAIIICYELIDNTITKLAPLYAKEHQGQAVMGAVVFFLLHEYGHALIHQLKLPVTGKEEDAVDQLAALLLLKSKDRGVDSLIASQAWFAAMARQRVPMPFWDEHSMDLQRYYTISCLIYGSAPQKYANWVGAWLPANRAQRCPLEFAKHDAAWETLLKPHVAQ